MYMHIYIYIHRHPSYWQPLPNCPAAPPADQTKLMLLYDYLESKFSKRNNIFPISVAKT